MELRKQNYRSEKESCLLMYSAQCWLMTVCWGLLGKGWLSPSVTRVKSYDLRQQRVSLSWCHSEVLRTNPRLTVCWQTKQGLCFWCSGDSDTGCDCCHSSLLRIFTSRSTSYRTTSEILVNSHCSLWHNETKTRAHWVCHAKEMC